MAEFLSELEIRCCPEDENYWELDAPLIYRSDMLTDPASSSSTSGVIVVPKGFTCDLCSTRHIPFVSFIWGNRAHREGCLHDYVFRIDSNPVCSFSLANSLFIEAMEARGKSAWVRYPMFWGVWLFSYWGSYHKKTVDWKPGDEPPDSGEMITVQP